MLPLLLAVVLIGLRQKPGPGARMDATLIGTLLFSGIVGMGVGTVILSRSDREIYEIGMTFLVSGVTVIGVLALADGARNFSRLKGYERLVPFAGALLLVSPAILLFQIDTRFMIPLLVFSGIVLGAYGYLQAWKSEGRGVMYLFASAMVLMLAPFLVILIAELVTTLSADKVIYSTRFVGCHLPAPVIPGGWVMSDAPGSLAFVLGSLLYTSLLSALHAAYRGSMLRKLAEEGHIPPEIKLRLETLPYAPPSGAESYLDRPPKRQ